MEVIWEEYFIFLHASKKVYLAKSFDIHFMKVNSCVKKKKLFKVLDGFSDISQQNDLLQRYCKWKKKNMILFKVIFKTFH